MKKKSQWDMTRNAVRAARIGVEDTIKSLIEDNAYATDAPVPFSWLLNDVADVYSKITAIEANIETIHETESKGVTKLETEKEVRNTPVETGAEVESAGTKAGLGEKSEPVAPAPASEPTPEEPAPEKKASEEKKAPEAADEDAEKAERARICGDLFRVLKGQMDGKSARARTEEIRDAFLGKPTPIDGVSHADHGAFMAHMKKAIDDAKGEKNA